MEVFSARLKWLRERDGKSQREVSEKIGVSQPYYLKFEKNIGEPNLETLVKLSNLFMESIDFMCGSNQFDNRSEDLYYDYLAKRWAVEINDIKLKDVIELLNDDAVTIDLSAKVTAMVRLNKQQSENVSLMEASYSSLIEHLNTIPMIDSDFLTQEFWDSEYQRYKERYYPDKRIKKDAQ